MKQAMCFAASAPEASTIWEKRIRYDGICTHILRSYWCRVIAHFQKVRRYEQGKQKGMSFLSRAYPLSIVRFYWFSSSTFSGFYLHHTSPPVSSLLTSRSKSDMIRWVLLNCSYSAKALRSASLREMRPLSGSIS